MPAVVLDKSRGVSGRAATRRWAGHRVDHGAQYFTVRSREFEAVVDQWLADGVCFRWSKGFHTYRDGVMSPPGAGNGHPRYSCAEGMSALGKALSDGLDVRREIKVEWVRRSGDLWEVCPLGGEAVRARALMLTCPAPQGLALLDDGFRTAEGAFREVLESIRYAPCLSVTVSCRAAAPDWKGIRFEDDPVLAWIGDDTSKRGEDGGRGVRVFVMHATADFSAKWLDSNLDEAADRIIQRAVEMVGPWIGDYTGRFTHRWRYALVTRGYNELAFLRTVGEPVAYAVGDAFRGARLEGAFLSGYEAAEDLIRRGQ